VLFSTIARMEDISKAVTLDAKMPGDLVYVLGTTYRELGGSEFYSLLGATGNEVPQVRVENALALYNKVSEATGKELCRSLHTPVFGGLGVAFAKTAIGGRLGLDIDLGKVPVFCKLADTAILFSESNSRFVATVAPENKDAFEAIMAGLPCNLVGTVTATPVITFRHGALVTAEIALDDAVSAYKKTLKNV
jgi:phosphoribosylformylglycinamidine synthase